MKFKYIQIYILLIFLISSLNVISAPYTQLGVNLDAQGAFTNIINHTNRYSKANGFDVNGWPTSDFELVLIDGRPAQEWNNDIDDPEEYRIDYSGIYKCSFIGSAEISLWGSGASIQNKVWDGQNNQTYFDIVIPGPPGTNHGIVVLTFTNTARSVEGPTNMGITNLKVMRPGYDLNTNKIFTDEYINLCKSANFACYRYYTLQNIWSGEPVYPEKTIWENRKTPFDASQVSLINSNGKRDGWCWEYIIELANILKKDIWICIHISCDSNYVIKLAEILKENLDASINIYVENSNEVWSPTQLTHGPYNKSQADDFGITFDQNYARRTVELSGFFAQIFGQEEINKRIRVILAGQHSYPGRHDLHLDYINNTFGPPKNYIYALSTALYFGSTNPNGTVKEINDGMVEDINAQINEPSDNFYRKVHIDKANTWELPGGCTSYEGGPGLPGGGGKNNLDNQINAHRTLDMKDIMKMNYSDGWLDMGGGLALQFTLMSTYNRYGCWGLTDDYTKPDRNYKIQAIRELIGEWQEVSVEENKYNSNDFFISPNPASDYIEINVGVHNLESLHGIRIYNMLGECVLNVSANGLSPVQRIDVSGLTNGLYYCLINYSDVLKYKKFIIVK